MTIILSRRTILTMGGTMLAAAVLIFFLLNKFSIELFTRPAQVEPDSPALASIGVMYSGQPENDRRLWEETVCSGMSADGCTLFKAMYASVLWSSRSATGSTQASMLGVAEELEDGTQVWRVRLNGPGLDNEIFVHTSREPASGEWLLERVLFTQESWKYQQ